MHTKHYRRETSGAIAVIAFLAAVGLRVADGYGFAQQFPAGSRWSGLITLVLAFGGAAYFAWSLYNENRDLKAERADRRGNAKQILEQLLLRARALRDTDPARYTLVLPPVVKPGMPDPYEPSARDWLRDAQNWSAEVTQVLQESYSPSDLEAFRNAPTQIHHAWSGFLHGNQALAQQCQDECNLIHSRAIALRSIISR